MQSHKMEELHFDKLQSHISHGQHLLSAFYKISKRINAPDAAFLKLKDAQSVIKALMNNKPLDQRKLTTLIKIKNLAEDFRYIYSVLQHYRQFQQMARNSLVECITKSKELDFTWNYMFGVTLMRLYTIYVKLAMFMVHIGDLTKYIVLYKYFYEEATGTPMENAQFLLDYLKDRDTLKSVEFELQILTDPLFNFFKGILPQLQVLLANSVTFPWKKINLSDNPKIMPKNKIFYKPLYMAMMYLDDICDWFLCYGLISLHIFATDSYFFDTFVIVLQHRFYLTLYGDVFIYLKDYLNLARKYKDKKFDVDMSFIENADANYARTRISIDYRRRKLAMIAEEFLAAIQVDKSIISNRFVLINSVIGYINFELNCAFSIKIAQPSTDAYDYDIMELLYCSIRLTSLIFNASGDIQRFFLFNLREFDASFLDHVVHSFMVPKELYDKVTKVMDSLKSLDIAEYDEGVHYNLQNLQIYLGRIFTYFNRYSTDHGVAHLYPLFNLLSAVYFRLDIYQNLYDHVLSVSKLHEYWPFMNNFESILHNLNHGSAKYYMCILHLCHFYGLDNIAISENHDISVRVKTHYDSMIKLMTQCMFSWFKALQENCLVDFRNQLSVHNVITEASDSAGKESSMAFRKNLLPSNRLFTKISSSFIIAREIGIIRVIDDEHDVEEEISSKLENIVKIIFQKETIQPPIELEKKLQTARWVLQYFCASSGYSFSKSLYNNMHLLIQGEDNKLGKIAAKYKKMYISLIMDILPSAFYSTALEQFIPLTAKPSLSTINHYMSIPALRALRKTVGTEFMLRLTKSMLTIIKSLMKELCQLISKVLKGPQSAYETGVCNFEQAYDIIKHLCHISQIIKLRQIMFEITDTPILSPNDDKALRECAQQSGLSEKFKNNTLKIIAILGSLMSSLYWDGMDYNVVHDAITDNSHIIAYIIDAILGDCIESRFILSAVPFYQELVKRMILGIYKGIETYPPSRKNNYPGLNLMIVVDQLVKNSVYADYSILENIISYQFIRSIYSVKLNAYKKAPGESIPQSPVRVKDPKD